jgi:ankyrin repeat protein
VQDGHTPLHNAAMNGHTSTVEALLAAKADVNSQSDVSMCHARSLTPTSRSMQLAQVS